MSVFILFCALMLLLALAAIAWPLLTTSTAEARSGNVAVLVLTALTVTLLSSALYLANTKWSWNADSSPTANADHALAALRQKTLSSPDDANAWMELGKAYATIGDYAQGVQAFQKAYDLTQGQNVDVVTGLAEVLVLSDQSSFNVKVAALIDEALKLQPMHPKALWYGGVVALQSGNLPLARDRFKTMLALNPPQQVRTLLERQIQDLDEQLGDSKQGGIQQRERRVQVTVSIAANISKQLQQPISLFVLARIPKQPGPPLAVERHLSSELPLQVELTTADAMLPTRTLKDADEVEIVARLSASGTPTEQPGDYFGTAHYSFVKQGEQGSVTIEINRRVP